MEQDPVLVDWTNAAGDPVLLSHQVAVKNRIAAAKRDALGRLRSAMGRMSRTNIEACRRKIDEIVGEVERDAVDVDDLFREATGYRMGVMELAAKLSRLGERLNAEVAAAAGLPVPAAAPAAGAGFFPGRADSGVESPAAAGGRQAGSAADPFFSPIGLYSSVDNVAQRGRVRGPIWI